MTLLDRVRRRWSALIDRRTADVDLDDELGFHLDMETEYQMRMGLSQDDARRKARAEFGGVDRYREESRDARGVSAIEDFIRDVRVSVRSLRRAPGFALVSILTVALGVGSTTAVFSLVDGILLRPLPFPKSEALIRVFERSAKYPTAHFSGANFLDLQRRAQTLQSVAAFSDWDQTVLGLSEPLRVDGAAVSDRFFDVLGVHPAQGRTFLPGEGASIWSAEQSGATVISDRFWRNILGGRSDWASVTLHTDQGARRIVGIMPPGFSYPAGVDMWSASTDDNPYRTAHNWNVIARLKDGRTVAQARAELDQMFGSLKAQLGKDIDAEGVTVQTLRESLTLKVRTLMFVLLGAVVLVLLVACTNLASANLARGESQQRELAVRASLGAARGRLVRQLGTEKIVLSVAGGILGIALSWVLVRIAVGLGPGTLPAFADVSVNATVMGAGLAIAVATGLITGIIPALSLTSNLRGTAARGGGGSGRQFRARRPLIAAEVALATMLLIGAGLFLRSFRVLLAEDPGFQVEHIVLANLTLPATFAAQKASYGDTLAIPRYFTPVLAAIRRSPGAEAVSVVNKIPLSGGPPGTGFMIDGGTEVKGNADYYVTDSAYFGTMGIRLLKGRTFNANDRAGFEHVVIISRQAAEKFWPGVDPIGHRIRAPGMDSHKDLWLTIIGVVQNTRAYGLDQPPTPQMYVSYLQRPERLQVATIIVRTTQPGLVIPALRTIPKEADPNVLVELSSMQQLVDQSVSGRRFSMTVLTAFSALALFLAAVGIYGVLAYTVAQRQREIGVRMALGSTRTGVRAMVLGDALRAVLPGVAMGLIGAFFTTRLIESMLYGVTPLDPITFIVTPAMILAVAVAASLWPATRAARVDPMLAMRAE